MTRERLGWCCILVVLGVSAVITLRQPEVTEASWAPVRRLAIQHKGRVKPFESFAREELYQLTGRAQFHGRTAVKTILAIMANPGAWTDQPLIALPYRPLRERLGFSADTAFVSYNALVEQRTLMRSLPAIVAQQQQGGSLSILELETMDVYNRFVALTDLMQHDIAIMPPAGRERTWRTLKRLDVPSEVATAWRALLAAADPPKPAQLHEASITLARTTRASNPDAYPARWRLALECWYYVTQPFRWAWIFYGLCVCLLTLAVIQGTPVWNGPGLGALACAIVWHAGGISMRVILSGHPPVTNFYETMLWLPLAAVVVGLILERRSAPRYFSLAAGSIALMALLLSEHVPLDPHIVPVVAVLRSNKWLMIHVLTIVASYGALALATALAHIYGAVYLRGGRTASALVPLDHAIYRAVQVGVILLTAGIMLGGVWANASWGRYWGWDPKETWALITLLWFIAILHGRIAGWLRGVGTAVATIAGFLLLLVTYYGVSFYMVGLHSYAGGNPKPLPSLLVLYLILEVVFVCAMSIRRGRYA